MVLNSSAVVATANLSANFCQYIACNPERLDSDQVLHLLCCFPLDQLRRLVRSLWLYLCFDPQNRSPPDSGDDDGSHSD
ncbi:hypothetical protein SLA2020_354980 [Shorea laevis]